MKNKFLLIPVILFLFYVSAHAEKIVLATGEWPPFTSDTMERKGFVSEIVTQVLNSMNIESEIKFYPWRRCYQYVLWNKVWAAFPYSYTEERAKEVLFSDDVAFSTTKFFYYSNAPQKPSFEYNQLTDLRQYKVGAIIGYYYEEQFKQAKLNVDYVSKEKMALEKLFLGRTQLLPLNEMVGWNLIKKTFPDNALNFGTLEKPLDRKSLKLLVNKENQKSVDLLKQFNAQLQVFMNSKQYQDIIEKYSGK